MTASQANQTLILSAILEPVPVSLTVLIAAQNEVKLVRIHIAEEPQAISPLLSTIPQCHLFIRSRILLT